MIKRPANAPTYNLQPNVVKRLLERDGAIMLGLLFCLKEKKINFGFGGIFIVIYHVNA